jgi:hypothetical protein
MNPKNDFIFYRDEKNNIYSGGYKIDNIFKKLNVAPIQGDIQKGGAMLPVPNLIVPAGLFYLQQTIPKKNINMNNIENGEISESLYDKLVDLVVYKSKNRTRKKKIKVNKHKTRKNK